MATAIVTAGPALAADSSTDSGPTASYIVQFTPGSDRAAEVSKAKALGMKVNAEYRYAISGMSVEANAGQLRALQANPNVQLVEKDAIATTMADQSGATWGLDRIDQRAGLDSEYDYGTTGTGVRAYIVDTGILSTHVEFTGRMASGYSSVGGTPEEKETSTWKQLVARCAVPISSRST
jgi:subtilisin family serine protease